MLEPAFSGTMPRAQNPYSGLMTTNDIMLAIAPQGRDVAKLHATVRQFQRQGYFRPVKSEKAGRKTRYYAPASALVAEVMLRACEFGLSSSAAMLAIARAIDTWNAKDLSGRQAPCSCPGAWVIRDFLQGRKDWSVEVWAFADKIGKVRYAARLLARERDFGLTLDIPAGYEARSVFAVDLSDVLGRLADQGKAN